MEVRSLRLLPSDDVRAGQRVDDLTRQHRILPAILEEHNIDFATRSRTHDLTIVAQVLDGVHEWRDSELYRLERIGFRREREAHRANVHRPARRDVRGGRIRPR